MDGEWLRYTVEAAVSGTYSDGVNEGGVGTDAGRMDDVPEAWRKFRRHTGAEGAKNAVDHR